KPIDANNHNPYLNSDHAGTPENFKSYVTGGATGGGGSNYTGSLSATASVVPAVNGTWGFETTGGFVGGFNLQDFSNYLAAGTLTVSAQDDNGDPLNADELARIDDAMGYINSLFGPYGVTLTWATSAADANVHIHFATSTPFGGMDEGVLGYTM